jgi:hypothetical protein
VRFINQEEIKPRIRELLADLDEAQAAVLKEKDPGTSEKTVR